MFSTNSSKICCSFVKNDFFQKSKMADIFEMTVAMATVLN